ncbi:putative beta-lysine N-acetyltransferase [Paludifilum halophilum]|nr:putative beta-lysine N-acetyltransferase [Paludifilum halophilum]
MTIPHETVHKRFPIGKAVDLEPNSRRIKVYQLPHRDAVTKMVKALKEMGYREKCDKIIFYVKKEEKDALRGSDFVPEGFIDGFFQGEPAYIYSMFLDRTRNRPVAWEEEQQVMRIVKKDNKTIETFSLPEGYVMTSATESDAPEMADLYHTVFETYPTPMNNPRFIVDVMHRQVYFTIVKYRGQIVSACSTDLLPLFNCAEISDCATLPEHTNRRLLSHQFSHQIKQMRRKGVQTLFCYARAVSAGMNLINARHGFTFGGRLEQNSNIAGRLECMNIWYKKLF